MNEPRRRRIWLPLLGSTLLATGGGGGSWAAYQFGWLSPANEVVAATDATTDADDAPPANDLNSVAPLDSSLTAGDLFAGSAAPMPNAASDATSNDAGSVAADPLAGPLAALGEPPATPLESPPVDELRGQTPGDDDPLANPLRKGAPRAIDAAAAREAFAQAGQLPAPPPQPLAQAAGHNDLANPLRPSRVVPAGGTYELAADAPLAGGAAPLSADSVTPLDAGLNNELSADVGGLGELGPPPAPLSAVNNTFTPVPTHEQAAPAPIADVAPLEPMTSGDLGNNSLRSASSSAGNVLRDSTSSQPRELSPPDNDVHGAPQDFAPGISGGGRPGEQALDGPQRPALVLQKFAPDEIQVGKECKFVVKVRNMGQRPADDVIVRDQVPHGTQLVSTQPAAKTNEGSVEWELGTLSPGEERELEMTLLPTDEGEIGSVASVVFSAHASAKSRSTRPQLALRLSTTDNVLVGRQQRVTIELHNPGTGDATNVMLLENVPENVRHEAGPALEFEIGTLKAGETRRLELMLTAERAGNVRNIVTARADGNLQVQQHVDFQVVAPGLAIDVEGPGRRYLERPATYTVKIENPGSAPAMDVQVVTRLPRGMKFMKANNLGEYDAATHSVYWSLDELPEGQTGSVELVAMPMEPGDQVLEVESRAREGLADSTTRQVTVEGLPAIMFEVLDLQDPIEVGGNTAYEVRVVNQGTKAATNVMVRLVTPPGMKVISATGETRHQIDAQGVTFEPLARLAPKADTLFRIQLEGVQAGDQRVMVEVDTDDLTQPVRKEESTRVFGDE